MLKDKFRSVPNKLHIFATYFMEKLSPTRTSSEVSSFNYDEVSNYTHYRTRKNINLSQKAMVLIPINYHNQHLPLAVIYPKQREVAYYDSMNANHTADDYLHIIQRYLTEEANVTHITFNSTEWTFHQPSVPKQTNCHDCGIYLLLYSHLIVHDLPI
jgi:Ulp1 family protease